MRNMVRIYDLLTPSFHFTSIIETRQIFLEETSKNPSELKTNRENEKVVLVAPCSLDYQNPLPFLNKSRFLVLLKQRYGVIATKSDFRIRIF